MTPAEALQKFYDDIRWQGWAGDEPYRRLEGETLVIDGSVTLDYLKQIVVAWEKYLEVTDDT